MNVNNDYFFLENLYRLLEQGYGIKETLEICKEITHHPAVDAILERIQNGEDLTEALRDDHLPKDFLEYYDFFSLRFTLSDAIKNSLKICKSLRETKHKLRASLTYPCLLIGFLIMFALFVTFILFPKINELFASFSTKRSFFFDAAFTIMKCLPIILIFVIVLGSSVFAYFVYALKHKKYMIIERFLDVPFLKGMIQKYFTLKFSLYFNELLLDHINANEIIVMLNKQMVDSDIKIMVYELYTRIERGEAFEEVIEDFEYFAPLFVTMYKMYLQSPDEVGSMSGYIELTYSKLQMTIKRFVSIFVPCVYGMVAFFVISIYFAVILPMMNVVSDI